MKKSDIAAAAAEHDGETFVVGETVIVFTVSFPIIGKIERITTCGGHVWLHFAEGAVHSTDVGYLKDTLRTGKIVEGGPVPGKVRINLSTVTEVFAWDHPLPARTK